MGQILHGSATTTEAVRRAIQHSQESLRGLAKRYGVNSKTVAKWKARSSVSDLPTGPKQPRSTVLSAEEEAVVVAFRGHTFARPFPGVCNATGSPGCRKSKAKPPPNANSRPIPIGYFHIDIAEVRTAQGKLYLLVAVDRTSKFAFVEMHEKVARPIAGDFLRRLIAAVP
jgi:hypothetical protein